MVWAACLAAEDDEGGCFSSPMAQGGSLSTAGKVIVGLIHFLNGADCGQFGDLKLLSFSSPLLAWFFFSPLSGPLKFLLEGQLIWRRGVTSPLTSCLSGDSWSVCAHVNGWKALLLCADQWCFKDFLYLYYPSRELWPLISRGCCHLKECDSHRDVNVTFFILSR